MFTPAEKERLPLPLEKIFTDLENRIFSDVIRRIKSNGEITRSADWQALRLVELGVSTADLKANIASSLKLSRVEIDALYDGIIKSGYSHNTDIYAGNYAIPFEKNESLKQLISAMKNQTNDSLKNITNSLGFAVKNNGAISFKPITEYYQTTLDGAG